MRAWRGVAGVLLAACGPRGSGTPVTAGELPGPPDIRRIAVSCDDEAGQWQLGVITTAWAGGGTVLWSRDATYVERHPGLRSVRAAPRGGRDQLSLDIAILTDFRAQEAGSTVFDCGEVPSMLVWVTDLAGAPSACRRIGPLGETLAERDRVPACDTPYALGPAETGDTGD